MNPPEFSDLDSARYSPIREVFLDRPFIQLQGDSNIPCPEHLREKHIYNKVRKVCTLRYTELSSHSSSNVGIWSVFNTLRAEVLSFLPDPFIIRVLDEQRLMVASGFRQPPSLPVDLHRGSQIHRTAAGVPACYQLRKIPTYDWDGERCRDYSEEAVRDLIAQKRMVAMIGRNDRLLFAQFVRPTTKSRPASRPKYKVVQIEMRLPGTEAVAALFAIDESEAQECLESYRRSIFSQVLLSRAWHALPPVRDKVVTIRPDIEDAPSFQERVESSRALVTGRKVA